jgi:hypothetical protein
MISKKKSQMRHFRKRWVERVGELMTREKHEIIIQLIQNGQSKLIRKRSNRVSIHKIDLDDISYEIVYDKQRKQIVTVFPRKEPTDDCSVKDC